MIDHVSFRVSEADAVACAGFYELLGFERVGPPAGLGERSLWLTRDGSSIHLMFKDKDGTTVDESPAPGAGHVAIVVERYEASLGALKAAGVAVEPRSEYWGSARSYTTDPAGHKVELMAFAPQFGPSS